MRIGTQEVTTLIIDSRDLLPEDDNEGLPDEKTFEKVSENSPFGSLSRVAIRNRSGIVDWDSSPVVPNVPGNMGPRDWGCLGSL